MTAQPARVLVAGELRPFARHVRVPDDVEVEWMAADAPTPAGDHVGLLPLLTRAVDADVMGGLPALRVVANCAVGYDNVDLDAARRRGIGVSNTPDVLTGATADLTWALLLAVCRRLCEAEAVARSGGWRGWHPAELLGIELAGRRLGLLGAGRIGRAVGRRAAPFGMEVLYWSRSARDDWAAGIGARRVADLSGLLGTSDIVSIHLPLTGETRGLIGRAELERMKPGAVLINTSRGGIVDEDALAVALESGHLWGAGLDVYEGEPRIPARLMQLPRVVLLPHIGSATGATRRRMFETAWANLLRGIRGEPLLNPVIPIGDRR